MGLPSISSGQSIVDESALWHTLGIVDAGAHDCLYSSGRRCSKNACATVAAAAAVAAAVEVIVASHR